MFDRDQAIVGTVGDWYLLEYGTFIKVCGVIKSPHVLPKFIHDRLVWQEITKQTLEYGVGASFKRDKKMIGPPLPLWVGSYSFKDVK
jgi:hypothetical protein